MLLRDTAVSVPATHFRLRPETFDLESSATAFRWPRQATNARHRFCEKRRTRCESRIAGCVTWAIVFGRLSCQEMRPHVSE